MKTTITSRGVSLTFCIVTKSSFKWPDLAPCFLTRLVLMYSVSHLVLRIDVLTPAHTFIFIRSAE